MHVVLLNWLFIFIVLLGFGWWGRAGLRKVFKLPFDRLHPTLHLLLGLTTLIVACNFCSFFIRINIEVNLAFSLLSIAGLFHYRKEVSNEVAEWWQKVKNSHFSSKIAFLLFTLIALFRTVSPTEFDDEGGYHLPLIRWMENYPVVPGIANIEDRMGFNTSKYIADAFFSVPYLFDGGLYELNSFLFLIFNGFFLGGYDRLVKRKNVWYYSNLIAISGILFFWPSYLTSTSGDYLNIFLGLTTIIILVNKIETKTLAKMDERTALASLFFTLLLTVKFSSALLGLPLLLLWVPLLRHTNNKGIIIKLVSFALLIFLPWMCRNYIISGYLVYPLYFIKLGEPDWQVLPEIAKGQYEYIREYAKTEMECSVNDYRVENLSVHEWFPYWFRLNWKMFIGKVTFVGFPFAMLFMVVVMIFKNKIKIQFELLLLELMLLIITLFWFFKFPSFRFFWGGGIDSYGITLCIYISEFY